MRTLLTLLFTLTLFAAQAKNTGTRIFGTAKAAGEKPVEAASVSLLQADTKKLVKVNVTNNKGEFEFENIKEGSYIISITAVGYKPLQSPVFAAGATLESFKVELPELQSITGDLGGVTVRATKPIVENKIDKTVVNVDAMLSNAGSSALDVLEKSPGVMLDKDGNISLKGKQGVIVLMDGRPTYLSGQDLANVLKNLPASELEQLEIMTQPPAKYDASGTAGVINIRTKKNKANGFNGSVTLAYIQARYPKSPNSLNLNWRKNKLNVFANYSFSYWEGFNEIRLDRNFRGNNGAISSIFEQATDGHFSSRNHTLKTGLDYNLDKKTTVGVVLNGTYNPSSFNSIGQTAIMDANRQLTSVNYATSDNASTWRNASVNLNMRRTLKQKGEELSMDADYIWYGSQSDQLIKNDILAPNGTPKAPTILLKGDLPSDISIYSFKTDYVLPLKKEARFEAGFKTSFVKTDNNAKYTNYNPGNGTWTEDARRSTHFIYDENINAAYVNYSRQFKKWGIQTGLRLENTQGKGRQVKENVGFTRNYTQLFPTVYVSRKLNDNNTMVLNYGRRIERPNYQDMNPFINFLDSFTYRQGNPYLLPQFTHNIELSHNFKGALNTTLNYTYTKNIINDILRQTDSTQVTFQTKDNVGKRTNIGLAISYNAPVTKWYTISFYANGYYNHYKGVVNNKPLDVSMASYMVNINNQFRFAKTWGAEMSGFYRSQTQDAGIIVAEPMGVIHFAFSKQILKNQGSLKLALNDPFWIQKFKGYTKFDNIDMTIRSRWDNRRIGLTFTYRFGKQMQQAPQRRRAGGAQEEQQRAGTGQGQQG